MCLNKNGFLNFKKNRDQITKFQKKMDQTTINQALSLYAAGQLWNMWVLTQMFQWEINRQKAEEQLSVRLLNRMAQWEAEERKRLSLGIPPVPKSIKAIWG